MAIDRRDAAPLPADFNKDFNELINLTYCQHKKQIRVEFYQAEFMQDKIAQMISAFDLRK
jgi:hypothetical protein